MAICLKFWVTNSKNISLAVREYKYNIQASGNNGQSGITPGHPSRANNRGCSNYKAKNSASRVHSCQLKIPSSHEKVETTLVLAKPPQKGVTNNFGRRKEHAN